MRFLLTFAIVSMLAFLPGCGEKPADETGTDSTAVAEAQSAPSFDFQTPELAVGQWIAFGADQDTTEIRLSVVAEELFQSENCYWLQLEADGEPVQVLINPAQLREVMSSYSGMANEFYADPAAFIEANMAQGTEQMMTSEENIQNFMDLLRAVKMVKVSENGTVMAYDLTNVPATLEPVLQDSAFLAQIQAGVQMNVEGADNQAMADSLAAKIAQYEFNSENAEMEIAGTSMSGARFTVVGPDADVEIFLSSDLPILPFGYARARNVETGEEHIVEVRGFGTEGAVDLMPGAPSQTVDIAPMVQMLVMQMQSQMQQAGAQGNI